MVSHGIALILFTAGYSVSSFGAKFYKWVDEEGTVYMTDDVSQIPPQYRDQVEEKNNSQEPARPDKNQAPPGNTRCRGHRGARVCAKAF